MDYAARWGFDLEVTKFVEGTWWPVTVPIVDFPGCEARFRGFPGPEVQLEVVVRGQPEPRASAAAVLAAFLRGLVLDLGQKAPAHIGVPRLLHEREDEVIEPGGGVIRPGDLGFLVVRGTLARSWPIDEQEAAALGTTVLTSGAKSSPGRPFEVYFAALGAQGAAAGRFLGLYACAGRLAAAAAGIAPDDGVPQDVVDAWIRERVPNVQMVDDPWDGKQVTIYRHVRNELSHGEHPLRDFARALSDAQRHLETFHALVLDALR